jgi:hypothetical protein
VFPERNQGLAHYDASKVVRSALSTFPRPNTITYATLRSLRVRVVERYGATPSLQASLFSGSTKMLKASATNEQFTPNGINALVQPDTKWLTENQAENIVLIGSTIYGSILNTSPNASVEYLFYDASGISIGSSTSVGTGDHVSFALSPTEIDSIIGDHTDVARIEVFMNQSKPLIFEYVTPECGEYTQVNWLNNLGAYEQFLFTHANNTDVGVVAQEYKKQFGNWDAVTQTWSYNLLNTGDQVVRKSITDSGTLVSGWLTEAEKQWLTRIVESTDVAIDATPRQLRIIVGNTKVSRSTQRFDEIFNMQLEYAKPSRSSLLR